MDIGIFGATGRFGRAIANLALKSGHFQITAAIGRSHLDEDYGTFLGLEPLGLPIHNEPGLPLPDLFIDVSLADGLSGRLQYKRPMVIGTTALSLTDLALIHEASQTVPIFYSSNFSLGIALLKRTAAELAKTFHHDASIDLIETHHTEKKDSPSGSALSLSAAIKESNPNAKVTIHSIRSGSVIGEHTLQFNTAEEKIELSHTAHSRDAFARGVLSAARFLMTCPPGLYGMDDLLAGKRESVPS